MTDEFIGWYEVLTVAEQTSIDRVIGLLEEKGATLAHPYSTGILGSKFSSMRELRVQHAGDPYRVLYAFDTVRQAVLLVGGAKKAQGNRWYDEAIRLADRLFDEYLRGV